MPLQLQSQDINATIGALGDLMGRDLPLSRWQEIDEVEADMEL